MPSRILVAFEPPPAPATPDEVEKAWDAWVDLLRSHRLQLPHDLDPINVFGDIELYEAEPA